MLDYTRGSRWNLAFICIYIYYRRRGLCRGHTLSLVEGSLQFAFLMVRLAQTGVLFSSVPCT